MKVSRDTGPEMRLPGQLLPGQYPHRCLGAFLFLNSISFAAYYILPDTHGYNYGCDDKTADEPPVSLCNRFRRGLWRRCWYRCGFGCR
jgi:hypothetical protein